MQWLDKEESDPGRLLLLQPGDVGVRTLNEGRNLKILNAALN